MTAISGNSDLVSRSKRKVRFVRRLNLRMVGLSVLVVAVVVPAGYYWHSFQLNRIATVLVARAEGLASKGNWQAASDTVFRYLMIRPQDVSARKRLAQYYDRSIESNASRQHRAIELYYQAIGSAPVEETPALRRRLAELLLESARYTEAKQEANTLLAADSADPVALRVLAASTYGQFQVGQRVANENGGPTAGEAIEQALVANPQDTKLASTWATILREKVDVLSPLQRDKLPTSEARIAKADSVMDAVVNAVTSGPDALLARYAYRTRYELPGAEHDLTEALRLSADRADVVLLAARHYRQAAIAARQRGASDADTQQLAEEAIRHYQKVVEQLDPKNEGAYLELSEVYQTQGKSQAAIDVSLKGIQNVGSASPTLQAGLTRQFILAGKLQEAEEALQRLDEATRQTLSLYDKNSRASLSNNRDLIEATLRLRQGNTRKSISLARPLTAGTLSSSTAQLRAWLLLGDAYAAQGDWDQSATAFDNAVALDAKQEQARIAAADAWIRAGQPAKAVQNYELAMSHRKSPDLALRWAQAWLAQQLTITPRQRDWTALERALSQLASPDFHKDLADPWRIELLQADYALARASEASDSKAAMDQVVHQLKEIEQKHVAVVAPLRELTVRYERLDRREDADRMLAHCQRIAGSTAANQLLASKIYGDRKEFDRARKVLHEGLATLPPDQHPSLQGGLARVDLMEGKLADARRQYQKFMEYDPQNLAVASQLAELALEAGDQPQAQQWEERIRTIEGNDGTVWRYVRARRLLANLRSERDPAFEEVVTLQEDLQRLRPSWPFTVNLQGMLAELQGNVTGAIAAYQAAIQLGESRIAVYERLVALLYQQRRFAEADNYMVRLADQIPTSQSLLQLAISVAAGMKDMRRADALAKQAVDTRPSDPMAWIWYGQVLRLNKQPTEAEAACRRATEIAPNDVRGWSGLFSVQLGSGKPDDARKTLDQLVSTVKLSDGDRAYVLAQGHELLGDAKQAEAKFVEATQSNPDSLAIWKQYCAFLLRHDARRAEGPVRRLLELAGKSESTRQVADNARRTLAAILAARGGDDDFNRAMQLLQQAGADASTPDLDKRLQAMLVSRRANPDLPRAQELLEDLVFIRKSGTDGDRLLLAGVYAKQCQRLTGDERKAKAAAAREQFEILRIRPQPNPQHLLAYVEFLIDQSQWRDAEEMLERVESLTPGDFQTVVLRTRWLDRQGRRSDIAGVVESFGVRLEELHPDKAQRGQQYSAIGSVYTTYGLHAAAELWFRKALALDRQRYVQLASCLAAQGKQQEAIDLCLGELKQSNSAASATALAAILMAMRIGEDELKVYQPVLDKVLAQAPKDPGLLVSLANLRALHQRNEEAIALYRMALQIDPKHLVALNNLATLLAEQPGKVEEALQYVELAIQLSGPQPALLDTKGMALMYGQRAAEAVGILRQALDSPYVDPRFDFHLAVALQRVGELQEAKTAFQAAIGKDLKRQLLTENDLKLLAELERQLK